MRFKPLCEEETSIKMTNKQPSIQRGVSGAAKIALFFLAVFSLNTTASAQVEASKQYQIAALHSNKCVDVLAVSTRSGQAVHQYQCLRTDNQNWQFEPKMMGNEVAYPSKRGTAGNVSMSKAAKRRTARQSFSGTVTAPIISFGPPKKLAAVINSSRYKRADVSMSTKFPRRTGRRYKFMIAWARRREISFLNWRLATVANIEFASFKINPYEKKAGVNKDYVWTGGAPFERTIYNPLDGGVLLRYSQNIVQGDSDGCSNPFPDTYNAFFQQACFAHDTTYSAPFQLAGFPNYESDGSSTGRIWPIIFS